MKKPMDHKCSGKDCKICKTRMKGKTAREMASGKPKMPYGGK